MGSTPHVPASISVTEGGDADFKITRRWSGTRKLFGVAQPMFLFGLAIVVDVAAVAMLVTTGKYGVGWPIFVMVGLLTYVALTGVVNCTTISARDHALRIQHGQLPWLRSLTVPIDQIARIEVKYGSVRAVLRNEKDITLLAYPRWVQIDVDETTFIAQELRRRLGIHELPA